MRERKGIIVVQTTQEYNSKFYADKAAPAISRKVTVLSGEGVIAKTIIAMSASLGMDVIAEGVETTTQLDMLLEHGCNNIQGYYFSKPLPASEFPDFVAKFYGDLNLQRENA